MDSNQLPVLTKKIEALSEIEALTYIGNMYPEEVVFSSSFGLEDQVITDIILTNNLPISIFTLDTGRMFRETYSTWSQTNDYYHTKIKAFYPKSGPLEDYIFEHGPNAFYESIELRKQCCFIRKVEPLGRALQGKKVWITGMRAEQSANRHDLPQLEWDETHQVYKFHPLLHWTFDDVKKYISDHHVPYNPLQDQGFVSIGCQPCTRAIKDGEDFRAGRWWWEDNSKKECGLHIHAPLTSTNN